MTARRLLSILFLLAGATLSWGQPMRRGAPATGYIYPAGARQGATVHAVIGGQFLRGVTAVHVSGEGVTAKAVDYGRPLSKKDLGEIGMHLRVLMRQRWAELMGKPMDPPGLKKDAGKDEDLEPLPDHPWLRGLDKMTLKQLDELRMKLFNPKAQPNAQLGEMVYVDLTIGAQAAPGARELRLETPEGLTNPLRFFIGTLPEVSETEPNTLQAPTTAPALPVVLDGQIMPGDVDVFRFKAKQGQKLVMTTQARSLTPYLADAVPGWFQAILTLYDASGKQLALVDDYRYDPDPVMFFPVPADGEYALQINDSIYRGREDFVYRITVAEQPFVTGIFPLGGTAGQPLNAQLTGWNLPQASAPLDTAASGLPMRSASWQWNGVRSNPVAYAVDSLPAANEAEPNDEAAKAQAVGFPQALNGRIGKSGDVDCFRFQGRAGEEIIAEVQARRLGSPLDSLLRLTDAAGQVLALNDDHEDKACALLTHHADSWLTLKLPKDGTYTVAVADTQRHGGDDYAYRLCLRGPQPDFALLTTPSSLKVASGTTAVLEAHVIRRDGFDGPVDLSLGGPAGGFTLSGGRINAGQNVAHMTITAPAQPGKAPVPVQLVGKAQIGGASVTRNAVPAEELMQAFAYWHLVPAERLMVLVGQAPRWVPPLTVTGATPVKLPAGGTVPVQIKAPPMPNMLKDLRLELKSAPDGVSIKEQTVQTAGLALVLQCDKAKVKPGPADNLIFEGFVETEQKRGNGKTSQVRVSVGLLPAVPLEIVP